jgi:chorismate mutase-like protein
VSRILLALLLLLVSPAQACSPEALFILVSERLAHMPAVADYKYVHDLPVTDAARERKVVESAVQQAIELDLPTTALASFIRAQMEAAKVIQRQLIQQWQLQGRKRTGESADLIAAIRPRLNNLGQRQLLAVQCLRERGLKIEAAHRQSFDLATAGAGLPRETADRLFASLLGVASR